MENTPPEEETPFQRMLKNPISWNDEAINTIESSVFRTIWTEPTETFRRLVAAQSGDWVQNRIKVIFVLGGVARSFNKVGFSISATGMESFSNLIASVLLGAAFGWISFIIYSALLCWTGRKILKGTAYGDDCKTIVAWSLIPYIVSMAFGILLILAEFILNNESTSESISIISSTLYFFCLGIEIILSVWSAALLVVGIRVIQQFDTGRAILNALLPGVLILVVFGSIALLFSQVFGV